MLLQDSSVGSSLPKLSVRVSEEDAQLACQQYISNNVTKASFLQVCDLQPAEHMIIGYERDAMLC